MNARQLRLYELLKPKLDAETASELALALAPDPEVWVTKDYLDRALAVQSDRLTWRMITVMGGWTAIGVSLFALMSQLFN